MDGTAAGVPPRLAARLDYYLWIALWPAAALVAATSPWRVPQVLDLWLAGGLLGWLWWSRMTRTVSSLAWARPSPGS